MKVDPKMLDKMAELEVQAYLEGLQDEELKRSPQFLRNVRTFLKDNELYTEPSLVMALPKDEVKEIPKFDPDEVGA